VKRGNGTVDATDGPKEPLFGRTALVTGAAIRVGAEIARSLAAAGARVAIHFDTSSDAARARVEEIRSSGGDAKAFRADLSRSDEISTLVDALDAADYRPDILVNSAALFEPTPTDEPDLDGWQRTLAVNLTAPYQLSMLIAPRMPETGGDIVNIADVWGMRPLGSHIAYSTSKAGLIMLTRALSRALAPRVRVNAVAPGPVLLPDDMSDRDRDRALARTLLGREGSASDVAKAVLFLVATTDYATGSVLTIDGGRSVV